MREWLWSFQKHEVLFSLEMIHSIDKQLMFGFYTPTEGHNTFHITSYFHALNKYMWSTLYLMLELVWWMRMSLPSRNIDSCIKIIIKLCVLTISGWLCLSPFTFPTWACLLRIPLFWALDRIVRSRDPALRSGCSSRNQMARGMKLSEV